MSAETSGTARRLVKESELRLGPSKKSKAKGLLPKGTILLVTGEAENGFLPIRVELEDSTEEGWVRENSVDLESDGEEPEPEVVERPRPKKLVIPQDEGILIRRDPSFFYGGQAGLVWSVIDIETDPLTYVGPGFMAGLQAGTYLQNNIPVRLELSYTAVGGNDANEIHAGFGLFDIAGSASYQWDPFEVFLTLQYSMGIGILDLPARTAILEASEVSTLWVLGGVGYRFNFGGITSVVVRGRYGRSIATSPVGFQTFSLLAYLEVRG